MKLQFGIFFFIVIFTFFVQKISSQTTSDLSKDVSINANPSSNIGYKETINPQDKKIIGKIELFGLKSTSARIHSEFPVLVGDIWDTKSKNRIVTFLNQLNEESIISKKFEIKEESIDDKSIKLDIYLSEQLPFFPFVLPFYSTTYRFKAKFKFWNFHTNGYAFPIEAEVETKQYDYDDKNLQISVKSNDYLKINDRLSFDFDFKAYTTALHYLVRDIATNNYLNDRLKNGIEDLSLKFKYEIPYIEATFIPRIAFGYGNEIVKDRSGDLMARDVYRKDIVIIDPHLEFLYPFKSIPEALMQLKVGLDFRAIYYENPNYYDNTLEQIDKKMEYAIGLSTNTNNNPGESPNILDSPSYLKFDFPIPGIKGTVSTDMNIAYQKNVRGDPKLKLSSKVLIPQEYTESAFKTLLNSIKEKADRNTIRRFYRTPEDNNVSKRFLDKNISESDADKILKILTESGNFIEADALLLNPNINFRFPIYNTGLTGLVGFSFDDRMYWTPINNTIADIENRITLTQTLGLEYVIPLIDANFNSYLSFYYYKRYNSNLNKQEYFIKDEIYEDAFGISNIEFVFEKKFKLDDYYLDKQKASDYLRSVAGNSIKTRVKFMLEPLLQYKYANHQIEIKNDSIYNNKDIPNTRLDKFKFLAEFTHSLYLPTYKESAFKLRSSLFATYNNIIEDFNESSTKSLIRGNGYNYLGGWFGLIVNFDYWLHLFNFNTPKIGGFNIDQDLNWDMFWVFYTDIGAVLSDMRDHPSMESYETGAFGNAFVLGDYTININNLSIIPIVTIGTAIRIYTRFMPMMINLEINLTPLNYIIQGGFGSLFYFEFSISRSLGNSSNWFAR